MVQKFEFNKEKIPGLIEITPFNADDIREMCIRDRFYTLAGILGAAQEDGDIAESGL